MLELDLALVRLVLHHSDIVSHVIVQEEAVPSNQVTHQPSTLQVLRYRLARLKVDVEKLVLILSGVFADHQEDIVVILDHLLWCAGQMLILAIVDALLMSQVLEDMDVGGVVTHEDPIASHRLDTSNLAALLELVVELD